jgi:hypothetical protein
VTAQLKLDRQPKRKAGKTDQRSNNKEAAKTASKGVPNKYMKTKNAVIAVVIASVICFSGQLRFSSEEVVRVHSASA